jgi:hypothetical protein
MKMLSRAFYSVEDVREVNRGAFPAGSRGLLKSRILRRKGK